MNKRMTVIDGNSLLYRAFYAIPRLNAPDGMPTNALYGFLNTYLRIMNEFDPQYVVVALDVHAPTFRHKFFDAYKGTRKPTPEDLIEQSKIFAQLLETAGICVCTCEGFEADDILGKWSAECDKRGIECLLITGDRDSLQLITDNTNVILVKNLPGGGAEFVRYDKAKLFEKYALTPTEFIDLKALMGDSSDNIPGVAGIGEVTALKLLAQYRTLEGVYENIDSISGKLHEKLEAGKTSAFDSRYLATIVRDFPMETDWEKAERTAPTAEARALFSRLGFYSLIEKFGIKSDEENTEVYSSELQITEINTADELEGFVKTALQCKRLAFHYGEDVSFSDGESVWVLCIKRDLLSQGLDEQEIIEACAPILATEKIEKVVCQGKELRYTLGRLGVEINGICDDIAIGAYLCDVLFQDYSAVKLTAKYLGKYEGTIHAGDIFAVAKRIDEELQKNGLTRLYRELELPLVDVLYGMEKEGIAVDEQSLRNVGEELDSQIKQIAQNIYDKAGEVFNINSPKQLGTVLFEKLGLYGAKKNKNGNFSTDIESLEKIADEHPVVADVIDYRQLTKLKNTYVDGLLSALQSSKDGRIHTRFLSTVAATGRLSSVEPNLQNIPVRTQRGKELRRVFVAKEGCVLIDADYSQIELRVMAHMSKDEHMLTAFRQGEDIHASTAARVFGIPSQSVTPEMRSKAKAVNFGIIYGISDFGLAKNTGITRKEAAEFIQRYLDNYSGIKEYMDATVEEAQEKGFASTLYGRRRRMPELQSRNYIERQFGKRVAMNMPIQGTAADIIKFAMLRVEKALRENGLEARMLLQVHDEILIEAPVAEEEKVKELLSVCMQEAVELSVELQVSVTSGKNWYDCK